MLLRRILQNCGKIKICELILAIYAKNTKRKVAFPFGVLMFLW